MWYDLSSGALPIILSLLNTDYHIATERVETTINRLCCPYGGVVEGEIFVPSHHFPLPPSSKDEQLCKGVAVLQLNCFEKIKEVCDNGFILLTMR